MPFYEYHCSDCKKNFHVQHSMSEECDCCEVCESENVTRVVATIGKNVNKNKYTKKSGDLVKSHIEDARRDIRQEKIKLKKEVYVDD